MKELYEFGSFTLDVTEGRLLREGQAVPLTPKVLETLIVLVENTGHTVGKDELMQRLWPDSYVEEANLAVNISQLRKALGENGGTYIETVPKRGYRFNAQVTKVLADPVDMVVRERTRAHVVIDEIETGGHSAMVSRVEPEPALLSKVQKQGRLNWIRQHQKLMIVTAAVVGIGAVVWAFILFSRSKIALQQPKLTRVTNIGRVGLATISPNGQYVAYVTREGRKQGLWVHHIATGQDVEVLPPTEHPYWSINFTPDSNYIDYHPIDQGMLYRVGVFGGPSQRVVTNILSDPVYSPDHLRMAFIRSDRQDNESQLITANVDGTGEKVIISKHAPEIFSDQPNSLSWAPDGKSIMAVFSHYDPEETYYRVGEVSLESGTERPVTNQRWPWVLGVATAGNGDLFITAGEAYSDCQIWRLSHSNEEWKQVTNDVNGYFGLTVTNDSQVATVQQTLISTIWSAPNGDASRARQISSNTTDGRVGLSVGPDGRIVYTSRMAGNLDLWMMNADGTGKRQLTRDARTNQLPSVTPDGQYIVFSSNRGGHWGLWRVNVDGSNPVELTRTRQWLFVSCSPDSKWVVYQAKGPNGQVALWRVSIDGGEPIQLTHDIVPDRVAALSPDGKWIASIYLTAPPRLGVVSYETGDLVKTFDLPAGQSQFLLLGWTRDSDAICYTPSVSETKIWLQPLDGSPIRELTDFKTGGTWIFAWSPDGKDLVSARGGRFGDVVLISNLN